MGADETSSLVKTLEKAWFSISAHSDSGTETPLLSLRTMSGLHFGFTTRQNLRGLFASIEDKSWLKNFRRVDFSSD